MIQVDDIYNYYTAEAICFQLGRMLFVFTAKEIKGTTSWTQPRGKLGMNLSEWENINTTKRGRKQPLPESIKKMDTSCRDFGRTNAN